MNAEPSGEESSVVAGPEHIRAGPHAGHSITGVGLAIRSTHVAITAMQAQAEATNADVERIEKIVVETADKAVETGQLAKVNEAKIEAIVSSLEDQADIAKQSDAKLQQLIEIMLTKE